METMDNTPEAKEGDEVARMAALSISAQNPRFAHSLSMETFIADK